MNHFSGMSTGSILGKGIAERYSNALFKDDIDKIREYIDDNTGFAIERITADSRSATIILRARADERSDT